MSKRINFFLLLAVITAFTACNNVNKPAESVKEESKEVPTMNAKELAISDTQKQKSVTATPVEKMKMSEQKAVAEKSNSTGLQDLSSAKNETSANKATSGSATPMTDADRLRQRAAAQQGNAQNAEANLIDISTDPGKAAKKEAAKKKASVKNSKVGTPTVNTPTTEITEKVGAPTHEDWNALLSQYVSNTGKVNYSGLQAAQAKLNSYLDKLKNNPPAAAWSRNEKMAYWINAYNAFTVRKILDNYPLKSIQELSGGKVWDDKWINIGSKTYSLNEIENGILRPTYKDARIHFAVNCAAKSCPSIYNRAFTAANLESNLENLTKKFVNNTAFNTMTADKVTVSKIFNWYGSDFGDLISFLNKYSDTQINPGATIDYTEYDWALNE